MENTKNGINKDLLKKKIKETGMKYKFLAESLGITQNSFTNKVNGRSFFNSKEIGILKVLLKLTIEEVDLIFFTAWVDIMATKKETA